MSIRFQPTKNIYSVILLLALAACSPLQNIEPVALPPAQQATSSPVPASSSHPTSAAATVESDGEGLASVEDYTGAPALRFAGADNNEVELNLVQADLRLFLLELSAQMGMSVIIDESVTGRVTVNTGPFSNKLTRKDLPDLLAFILNAYGLSMEQRGQVYHIGREQNPVPALAVGQELQQRFASHIFQIVPLRYISITSALEALKPIKGDAKLMAYHPANLLGILADSGRLHRILEVLQLIDVPPFRSRSFRVFYLEHAEVFQVYKDLRAISQSFTGEHSAYHFLPLQSISALLAVAPAGHDFQDVRYWLDMLDRESDLLRRPYVYPVKNHSAAELAEMLRKLYGGENRPSAFAQPATGADGRAPFKQLFGGGRKTSTFQGQQQNDLPAPHQVKVEQRFPEGKLVIEADESTNRLLFRATLKEYREILEFLRQLDKAPPPQVRIDAVIAEISLGGRFTFGFDWDFFFKNLFFSTRTGQGGNSPQADSNFAFFVDAVAGDSDFRVLSRPSLLIRNGENASLTVGSDEPVIVAVDKRQDSDQVTNQVEYRNVGVILQVTPNITEAGLIRLDVTQEVSSVGPERTDERLPSFSQRKLQTSVLCTPGRPVVLGGLIQETFNQASTGTPGLRETPYLRHLFNRDEHTRESTELVIFIYADLVKPDDDQREFLQRLERLSELIV